MLKFKTYSCALKIRFLSIWDLINTSRWLIWLTDWERRSSSTFSDEYPPLINFKKVVLPEIQGLWMNILPVTKKKPEHSARLRMVSGEELFGAQGILAQGPFWLEFTNRFRWVPSSIYEIDQIHK